MTSDIDLVLSEVATQTFEQLAFMLPAEDGQQADEGPQVRAEIEFEGPFSGRIVLLASDVLLADLAANMLGLEPPGQPSAAQQQDAVKELLNVICGNVLPRLAGAQAVFNVGAPRLVASAQAPAAQPAAQVRLAIESGVVRLSLYFDSQAAAAGETPAAGRAEA